MEDGSYLRIQNIALGFNLPSNLLEKSLFTKVRFYVSIQNLHTFTNYSGFDVALGNLDQNVTLAGVDLGRYPVPTTTSIGVNIDF